MLPKISNSIISHCVGNEEFHLWHESPFNTLPERSRHVRCCNDETCRGAKVEESKHALKVCGVFTEVECLHLGHTPCPLRTGQSGTRMCFLCCRAATPWLQTCTDLQKGSASPVPVIQPLAADGHADSSNCGSSFRQSGCIAVRATEGL